MDEYAGDMWMRNGTSLVWDPNALHEAARQGLTVSLRAALEWAEPGKMPDEPPDGKRVIVVTGLRTVIDTLWDTEMDEVLNRVARLARAQSTYWPEASIVFALPDGTRLRVSPPTGTVVLDLGGGRELPIGTRIWGSAGADAKELKAMRQDAKGKEGLETIGYWLRRVA